MHRKVHKPLTRKALPFIATAILSLSATGCTCSNKGPEYCNKREAITEMKSRAERGSINPIIYDKGVMYINNNGDIVNLKSTCCYKRMFEALYRGVNDIFRYKPIPYESKTTGTDFKLAVYKYIPEIDPGGDKYMQMKKNCCHAKI